MLFYLKDKQSSNISLIFISFTQAHALSACSTHGHCPNMPTNTYHPRTHPAEGASVAVNNAVGSFVAEQSGVTNSIVGCRRRRFGRGRNRLHDGYHIVIGCQCNSKTKGRGAAQQHNVDIPNGIVPGNTTGASGVLVSLGSF